MHAALCCPSLTFSVRDLLLQMFNYLNELNQEIEKGEEQITELKQETEKYRGADKGAASQRKRLIRDLQERTADVEAKTSQYEDAYKVCTHTHTHRRLPCRRPLVPRGMPPSPQPRATPHAHPPPTPPLTP